MEFLAIEVIFFLSYNIRSGRNPALRRYCHVAAIKFLANEPVVVFLDILLDDIRCSYSIDTLYFRPGVWNRRASLERTRRFHVDCLKVAYKLTIKLKISFDLYPTWLPPGWLHLIHGDHTGLGSPRQPIEMQHFNVLSCCLILLSVFLNP
jgi:hypothetical protein